MDKFMGIDIHSERKFNPNTQRKESFYSAEVKGKIISCWGNLRKLTTIITQRLKDNSRS